MVAVGGTRIEAGQIEIPRCLRLPGESARAYAAFCMFRDLREARSLTLVGRRLGCSKQNIGRWATHWNWKERCLAYDRHLDAIHRAAWIAERRAMKRRQMRHVIDMQGIAMSQLKELQSRAEAGLPLKLSVAEIIRFIEVGAKLERAARGEEGPQFRNISVIHAFDEAELTEAELTKEGL